MNDLGLTLAWLAARVALLLGPALALHALASRRGPAAGARVATLSLGLVVILGGSTLLPRLDRDGGGPGGAALKDGPAKAGRPASAGSSGPIARAF